MSSLNRYDGLEVGAHTVCHPYMDQLSTDEQAEEIFQSKRQLSERYANRFGISPTLAVIDQTR